MTKDETHAAEAVFAQKLASCIPAVRSRALQRLRQWLADSESEIDEMDALKLWKGLYYCMWMQDKALVQEELAESMSELLSAFETREKRLLFVGACFETMSREWYKLDRWRIDKFMMLVRRLWRRVLGWLRSEGWDAALVDACLSVCARTVLSVEPSAAADGLRFHFASLYLDELDSAAGGHLSAEQVMHWLKPYGALLRCHSISGRFFDSIVKEVFEAVLLQVSERFDLNPSDDFGERSDDGGDVGVQFDVDSVRQLLVAAAKDGAVVSERRHRLAALAKRFETAKRGRDPYADQKRREPKQIKIPKDMIAAACERFMDTETETVLPPKRKRKARSGGESPKVLKSTKQRKRSRKVRV